MPKRTYQPNTRKAKKKHGFRKRTETKSGRNILSKRRSKGRKTLANKTDYAVETKSFNKNQRY